MGNPFNVHCPRDFVLKMTAEGTVSNVKVSFNSGTQDKINKKLYEVQQMIDSEVLRRCDPLVPFDTGALKQSGIEHTEIGSGNVIYRTVYARKQYYIPMQHEGNRTEYWFEHMKNNGGKAAILKAAQEALNK